MVSWHDALDTFHRSSGTCSRGSFSCVSLFTGAGGMDLGFRVAGADTLFANEWDPDAANTYRANGCYFDKDVMKEGDIHSYLSSISDFSGVDMVFGGPPCQGFSVAGKMDPSDERSMLVWTFMEVVDKVRPKVFVMENVKALGALSKWAPVREGLFERAKSLGYASFLEVLDASCFGVPQARERMIFAGFRGAGAEAFAQSFHDRLEMHHEDSKTVRQVLMGLPPYSSKDNPITSTAEIRLAKHPIIRADAYRGSLLFNGRGRPLNLDAVSKTLPAQMGGNHTPVIDQRALDHPGCESWVKSYHDALLAGSANPETVEVPDSLRRLTVLEAAALQTFPAGFIFTGSTGKQYRQVGNAVPCRLAYHIAASAREFL